MLVVVFCGVWLNRVGLPDFAKTRLVAALREHGVELEFSRMRVRFVRGLVAENVRIGDSKTPGNPSLAADELQLKLDFSAFLHRRLQVDGVILRQGKLIWPLTETNGTTLSFVLNNIQTTLRFQTNDTWSLDNFQADFAGAKFSFSGDIAHAPELRNWEIFHANRIGQGAWRAQLQNFSDVLDQIHFTGTPQLSLRVDGDARDVYSFVGNLQVSAPRRTNEMGQRAATFNSRCDSPRPLMHRPTLMTVWRGGRTRCRIGWAGSCNSRNCSRRN